MNRRRGRRRGKFRHYHVCTRVRVMPTVPSIWVRSVLVMQRVSSVPNLLPFVGCRVHAEKPACPAEQVGRPCRCGSTFPLRHVCFFVNQKVGKHINLAVSSVLNHCSVEHECHHPFQHAQSTDCGIQYRIWQSLSGTMP